MDRMCPQLTRFFRNPAQLKLLEHVVLPDILAHKGLLSDERLLVWSAGCSTGEEAYTLAMLFGELVPGEFSIVASDRSPEALTTARRAVYRSSGVSGVPSRYLRRCFTPVKEGYEVVESIRSSVSFKLEEIGSSDARGAYDLVVCRNVLTYVPHQAREAFAASLWEAMAGYSFLLLGGSESLLGVRSRFEFLSNEWGSVYRKR